MTNAITLDENYDLQARHGTLLMDDTSEQNAALIAETEKGEWKEHPPMGASLRQMLKSNASGREIVRRVSVALQYDGITAAVTINEGKLNIEL
jgi:hypothetical protein